VLLFEDWDVEEYHEQHPDNWDDDFEDARNSPRKAIRTAPTLALQTRKRIIQSLLNPIELLSIDCRLLLQQPTFSQVYLKGHIRVFPDPFHNGHLIRPFFLFHHRSKLTKLMIIPPQPFCVLLRFPFSHHPLLSIKRGRGDD